MVRPLVSVTLALGLLWLPQTPLAQAPVPPLDDQAMEEFLRTARVVRTRGTGVGVTDSLRATLTDGTITYDAHIQSVEESKREFRTKTGIEFDFRDSWAFNVAAYKIDRLIGLHMVPVSVERIWVGKRSAFTWWVGDVMMDELKRHKTGTQPPDPDCWSRQTNLVRVFDELIENTDRNLGNLLITNEWRVWAIDHTRAFRRSRTPPKLATLLRMDREVLARMEALEFDTLKRDVGRHLTDIEIRALLSRRDAIVAHFKARGEIALFDRQSAAAPCQA